MRIPLIPTFVVAAAVAVMIGLGVWQLQRAEWKAGLIARLEAPEAQRAATLSCDLDGRPGVRAGRNRAGEVGYRYLLPCRPGGSTMIEIGWSRRPDARTSVRAIGSFTGMMAGGGAGGPRTLILAEPLPPLEPSAVPSAADLPNNHLLYALQWFFFAFAAALIYALALRRKMRGIDRG